MTKLPNNNYLFDNIKVGIDENQARPELMTPMRSSSNANPLRESVTEKRGEKHHSTHVKDRLRQIQRVWTAMTKFVASQTANGRTVDLPLAGKFKKQRKDDEAENAADKFCFMPHLDFIGSGHFKYPENDANISPFSKGSASFAISLCTVSLTSIGAVCSLDRESVATALKSIFVEFIKAGRSGKYCKLDMRVGHLVAYPDGSLQFENYTEQRQNGAVDDGDYIDIVD